ncbi:MAG: O-antigen ligase family protein [Acidobacteria bacterium]|jgi:O-antigen ligase|nr:O-antigen ligase family protein [Acidobacteriota bacterium]
MERTQLGLLAALAATIPVSIFAAEVALALGAAVFAVRLLRREIRLAPTPLDAPLLAYAVWTLMSASFATDPAAAHEDAKELLLFLLFYLAVSTLTCGRAREGVISALFMGGVALATLVVLQYHALGYDSLNRRPGGFLGHYMSSSGVLMGVVVAAASRLALGRLERPRLSNTWLVGALVTGVAAVAALGVVAPGAGVLPTRLFVAGLAAAGAAVALSDRASVRAAAALLPWVAVPLGAWALVVSQTRNAWIGVVAGLGLVAVVRTPRLLWGLAAVLAALLLVRPTAVSSRLTVSDASTVDRYYMWQAGVDMVLDKPVFGQGPGMILAVYPQYRWPEAPNPTTPHLHNNALQIAATRGLPGLAFFTWWVLVALATALAEARRAKVESSAGWPAVAALGGLVAFLVAGLFEYNLGDSEVLMLALLLTSLPFARRRERAGGGV